MKKLVIILALVLAVMLVITYLPKQQMNHPTQPTASNPTTGTTPHTTPPTTVPLRNGWQEADGDRYYFVDDQAVTGWQEVDGLNRYFLPDGKLAVGFVTVDADRYYFDMEGCYLTGWQDVEGKRYYLGEDGVLFAGWLQQEDATYYLKEDGSMARGHVQIDGVNHYFTSTGAPVLLVNPWNTLPEDHVHDLVELGSYYADKKSVDSSCHDALIEMMKACNQSSGHRVYVVSAYRSVAYQEKLFNNQVQSNLNKGYSQEEAERLAAQVVAVPGTSEHHSGMAVDIIDSCCSWNLTEVQASLPGQQWLMEHCWEYGFILRYPNGTTDQTGIIYEPWHYRYVGTELAKELYDLGMTLEAYLNMLTEMDT